jgi:hypothetical protein
MEAEKCSMCNAELVEGKCPKCSVEEAPAE